MPFTVAILGRPNVGKSTLFNRLIGVRHALTDDTPGVTRDWRSGEGSIGPLHFEVIDTAGLESAKKGSLEARMVDQSDRAADHADVLLLVVDGRAGLTPQDRHFAKQLRRKSKPVIVVVNKAEGRAGEAAIHEAQSLGYGEPVAISAEHGEGMAELHDALAKYAPEEGDAFEEGDEEAGEDEAAPTRLQVAIVGRPNVGKSTLVNRLVGEERVLTGPEAGLTRDAIAVDITHQGKTLRLVDTAGMRRKANVTGKLEKLSVGDTLRAIRYAHVVVLVIDALAPLEKQDAAIASLIEREGRAVVIAVNKWDLVDEPKAYMEAIRKRLTFIASQLKGVTLVPISAEKGKGVDKLLGAVFAAYDLWNTRIGTGELNRWLAKATERHTPPMVDGVRLKVRYITQHKSRPPSFALFVNKGASLPDDYRRYLVTSMRETFGLPGVPIRLDLRKSKNPYAEEKP